MTRCSEYAALQPDLRVPTEQFVALVTSLLDDAGINYVSVTGRAKSVASFAAKATRLVDGEPALQPTRSPRSPTRSASGW